jgi:FAD synthetase
MSTKERKNTVKIMVFGTFDGLHQGHLNFFKQARSLTIGKSTLIVSIARDKNVKRIKKIHPMMNEDKRAALVKNSRVVDKVVLGGITNYVSHIARENPDIIALGYDQKDYVQNLRKDLKNKGLNIKIVRLKPYKKHIFKNHLLKKKMEL